MLYSLTILLIGIYLGQEFNLPSIKQLSLSLTKTYQNNQEQQQQENLQINYVERFINFVLNKQKNN